MTAIPIPAFGAVASLPGFIDTFPGADGSAPGNGWIDLATVLTNHAPAQVRGGRVGIGTAVSSGSGLTKTGLGQFGIYRKVGLTDGVEVTLRHKRATGGYDGDLDDVGWQFGPSVFVDPAGAQAQMGMSLTWDISVTSNGGLLVQMMGLFDHADWLNPTYYVIYEGAWMSTANLHLDPGNDTNQLRLRCFGGKIAGYWNGQRVLGPFDTPAWAVGRDGWGAHTIMAGSPISNVGNLDVVRVRPWTTSLGSYPAVPSVGTAASSVKATAAGSVAVPVPTVSAGQLLVAVVATNNGAFNTPSGWNRDGTAQVTSGIRASVFSKTADGTESGTVTFTRSSGTGDCAGFMFPVTGHNPVLPSHSAGAQANSSSSTSLPAASHACFGPNRQTVWVGAVAAATAITMPAGYTQIGQAGTSGAAINIAAGYKPLSTAGQSATGTITGTLASGAASVGLMQVIDPNPA